MHVTHEINNQSESRTNLKSIWAGIEKRTGDAINALFDGTLANEIEEKVVKTLWSDEARRYIYLMRIYLSGGNNLSDSFFDITRKDVVGVVKNVPQVLLQQRPEKQAEIQRWLFSTYIEGLVNSVRGSREVDAKVRGIAFSLLARDAKEVLKERRQAIDSDWLFGTVGPLIRRGDDPKALKLELLRFTQGDPKVIRAEQSPI